MIRKESVMEQWSTFGQQAIEVHYQSKPTAANRFY
jgi:hypothetical protein